MKMDPVLTKNLLLHQTDQTCCYDTNGSEISCAGTGQDGELRCGQAWPIPRFTPDENTVLDRLTGLMWSRNASLNIFPSTWQEAFGVIERMNQQGLFGFNDWRLPEYREMFSLISHRGTNPALPETGPFTEVFPGYYWTATPCSRLPLEAWYAHLGGGRIFTGMKHGSYMVWPVRRFSNVDAKENLVNPTQPSYDDNTNFKDNATGFLNNGAPLSTERYEQIDHILIDHATDLMWWRDPVLAGQYGSWDEALDDVKRMNRSTTGGHDDWRLPNIREMVSLVDIRRHSPAIPLEFVDIQNRSGCWTSTTSALDPSYAWVLYTQDGAVGVGYKIKSEFYALMVRNFHPKITCMPLIET